MGVPEQLRRLDEDLATGRVDAESYRRRRDEILASRLPKPPPPAARDDLDDSELDAADHELGLDDGLDGEIGNGRPEAGRGARGNGRAASTSPSAPPGPPPGRTPSRPPERPATPPRGGPPPPPRRPTGPIPTSDSGAARPPAGGAPPTPPVPPTPPGEPVAETPAPAREEPRASIPAAGSVENALAPVAGETWDVAPETPASAGVEQDRPDGDTQWTPLPERPVRMKPADEPVEQAKAAEQAAPIEQATPADQAAPATPDEAVTPEGPDDSADPDDPAYPDVDDGRPRGIPVPATAAEAPPLPETRPSSPSLRPPPPPADEEDDARTDERPLPADPFPPPFRWSAQDADHRNGGASPDTTQVVRDATGPAADRTQVVAREEPAPEATQVVRRRPAAQIPPPPPPPQSPRGTGPWPTGPARPGPPPPPERTQFVPGAVPVRSAGGGVARPEDTAPPWASAAARSEGLQGRELFARGPGPRAGVILGTVALLLLVAIVLVASIALA